MRNHVYDVTVIGAGPVGMYASFYAALRKLKVLLIDALPHLGGQLSAIYPEKYIYDIPGYPEIKAQDLVKNLEKQMATDKEEIDIVLNQRVDCINVSTNNTFEIEAQAGSYYTNTLIIATGKGAFKPRPLGIEDEGQYQNLHYYIKDIHSFRNKRVAIFGGGDSAVDWANMLDGVAKKVHVIHRRNQFRAHEYNVDKLLQSDATIYTPFIIDHVESEDGMIHTVYIKDNDDKIEQIDVDEVVVLFGFLSDLGPIEKWGLTIDGKDIFVNSVLATSIPNVYAIGDACSYEGKLKMITTGFGEATIAVNQVYKTLHPEQKNAPIFSSQLKR